MIGTMTSVQAIYFSGIMAALISSVVTIPIIAAKELVFNVQLSPRLVRVKEYDIANITCSYSCSVTVTNSHTTFWLLGDMEYPRYFTNGKRSRDRFTRWAEPGIAIVNVEDKSNCNEKDGKLVYKLSVNVTNAKRWNRTPVQCMAQATHEGQKNLYSPYCLLFVEPLQNKRNTTEEDKGNTTEEDKGNTTEEDKGNTTEKDKGNTTTTGEN